MQLVSLILIRWIVIYPVDSTIQRLNNRGLVQTKPMDENTITHIMKVSVAGTSLKESEIIPYFHEFTVLLPIIITRVTSYPHNRAKYLFMLSRTPRSEKFRAFISALGLQVLNLPVRILLDVLFRLFAFFLSVF